MKKTIIDTPPINTQFSELCIGELVTLRPEVDDKDYARVYKIIDKQGDYLTVEVMSENIINKDIYQKVTMGTLVGAIFKNIKAQYFQPYL